MGTGKRTQRSSSSSLSLASYELKTSPTMATSRTPDFTFHSISLLLSTKPLSNTLSSHKNNQTTSMKRKKKSRKERFLQSVAAVVVMDAKKTGLQVRFWGFRFFSLSDFRLHLFLLLASFWIRVF